MQDIVFKSTQEKINAHLVRLFYKQEWGLPDWEDILTIIDEVNDDPTSQKKVYVHRLYWALKDLFTVVYYYHEKLISIDESSRTLSYKQARLYLGKLALGGHVIVPCTVHIADEQTFNELYRDKPVASFNEKLENLKITKLQQYAKVVPHAERTKRHIEADRQAEFALIPGNETAEQKLDRLFEGFSIPDRERPSFEDFIDEIKPVTAVETKSITPLRPSDQPTTSPPKNSRNNPNHLTARERTLIICYEAKTVINRGEPDYGDYITFGTPTKRVNYANDSKYKAKPLIKSIRKILPQLNEKARQQAEKEIITIEANIV